MYYFLLFIFGIITNSHVKTCPKGLSLISKIQLTMNATIDMVTISSKGQIVIPKKILKALGLKEQDKLLLFNKGENILLKKVKPEMFERTLRDMLAPIRKEAEAKGLTERDVENEIRAHRAQKIQA